MSGLALLTGQRVVMMHTSRLHKQAEQVQQGRVKGFIYLKDKLQHVNQICGCIINDQAREALVHGQAAWTIPLCSTTVIDCPLCETIVIDLPGTLFVRPQTLICTADIIQAVIDLHGSHHGSMAAIDLHGRYSFAWRTSF